MKTKMFFLTFVVILLIATSTFAQPSRERPNPEEMAKKQTETLKKELTLSDEQAKKVNAVLLESSKKRNEAFKNNRGDREKVRAIMSNIGKDETEKINKVLTKEQQIKYAEYLKKREEERKDRRVGKNRPPVKPD